MTRRSVRGTESTDERQQAFRPPDRAELSAVWHWRAAEARLYPLILADPAMYEAAITLVGEASDVLRGECDTVAELIDIDPADTLARCPSVEVATAAGIDPSTAIAAACAQRWRELTTTRSRDAEAGSAIGGDRGV